MTDAQMDEMFEKLEASLTRVFDELAQAGAHDEHLAQVIE
jgi:hypothetical protein